MAFTSENLLNVLDAVTVAQRASVEKAAKKTGGIAAALSAYLRSGRKAHATVGALAHVYAGILETLAHGQKSKLVGFAVAAKRTTAEFRALVTMGILSEAGSILLAVEKGFNAKPFEGRAIDFIAAVLAEAAALKEADKLAREAATEAAGADAAGADAAGADGAAPFLSEGQQDDAAVARVIARISVLSTENIAALKDALAALDASEAATKPAKPAKRKKPVEA